MKEYDRTAFLNAQGDEVLELCARLSEVLSRRLQTRSEFHEGVAETVSELRSLGHDLWHINASDDFELWGPDYVHPDGPGLVTTFKAPDEVEVEWSAR